MAMPSLPNISSAISPSLAEIGGLSETASALTAGSQSVAESLAALVDNKLFQDAVVALANGLTKEAAVKWAVEAGKVVAGKLPEAELDALAGAEQWLSSTDTADQLAGLLKDNAMQGPGAWAAQAAAWADMAAGAAEGEAPPYDKAVGSAVKLAAALTANDWPLVESALSEADLAAAVDGFSAPDLQIDVAGAAADAASAMAAGDAGAPTPEQQLNDLLKPFVELGLKIAAGQLGAG